MSTLRVTGLKQETSTATNISLAVGGGVTVAGISTFYSNIDLGSNSLEGSLQVGTGATISGSTNTITIETAGTERLRVEGGGQVGIGTINPNTLFHVYGGTTKIQSDVATTGEYDLLRLQSGSTGGAVLKVFVDDASDNNANFTFKTNANENISFDVGTTNVLNLINGGNVGIGTTVPDGPFHILSNSNALAILESSNTNADLIQADPSGSTRIRNDSGELKIYTGGDASSHNATNSVEKLRIGTGHIGISTFVIAGQTDPVSTANTTAHIQSASQIIAVQGVLTRNGGWSMLPTTRVTLTKASDSINGHTVVLDMAGLNGNNDATLIRVSFAMRRSLTTAAFNQKSEYMGLWDITKISTDEHIDVNHIVQRELTVTSTTYASDTITMTFNTDNVRSFTARAFEYCTTGNLYTGV